jgi:hypothetical protein
MKAKVARKNDKHTGSIVVCIKHGKQSANGKDVSILVHHLEGGRSRIGENVGMLR